MDPRLTTIRRILLEHRNPYPPDDLITTYKDFLREREFLHAYRYNPVVFTALADLADRLWDGPGRINRYALVAGLKRYGFRTQDAAPDLEPEFQKKLWRLFRRSFEAPDLIPPSRLDIVRRYCSRMVLAFPGEQEDVQWLCDHVHTDPLIRTRLLTYPGRSVLISAWARSHYDDDAYRTWRPMLAAWLMDEAPDFEVSRQTLLEDFEYFNRTDMEALGAYEVEYEAARAVEEQLGEFLPHTRLPTFEKPNPNAETFDFPDIAYPEIQFSKRHYTIPLVEGSHPFEQVPDFETLRDAFHLKINFTRRTTMLWALAYSHLTPEHKYERMKLYYGDDTHRSFVRICSRFGYYPLLEWVEDKLQRG